MALLISTYKLEKSFASKTLFSNVSLGIQDGDRIGLVGPNGAGKSTLLKILMSEVKPDGGEVTKKKGLKLGYLAQTPQFNDEQTILDAVLEKVDAHDHLAEAYSLLSKLDLMQFGENFLVRELSGGWKKRVALARELIIEPELLLLDEPTNHLDVTSILWLEEFLESAKFATLIITHDRLFLQRVANKIFDLDPRNPNCLLTIDGDYLKYLEAKQQLVEAQQQRETVLKNTLRRETEWLRRGAQARQTKQKARIERAGSLNEEVSDLTSRNRARQVQIDFKETDRNPQKLIEADSISKSFGSRQIFNNFSYLVSPKTRLAILGDNGSGKTTLIKALLKQIKTDSGTVKHADNLQFAYFEQSRETLNPAMSLLRNICPEGDYVEYQGQYIFARSYLERFLFSRTQMDLPVEKLSGGEQSRLRLAQLMLKKAQVLILDEPTNDLDVDTLTVLEESLRSFSGAVILVTHDRYFMDQVAQQILSFTRKADGSNQLDFFTGYLQWEEWFDDYKNNLEKMKNAKEQTSSENQSPNSSSKSKKLSFKEKFELENIEGNILVLEEKLSKAQSEANSPEVVSDSARTQLLYSEISSLQTEVDRLYSRWAELEEKLKSFS